MVDLTDDEIDRRIEAAGLLSGQPVLDPRSSFSTSADLLQAQYDAKKQDYRDKYRNYLKEDDGSTLSSNVASALFAILPTVAGYALDGKRGASVALQQASKTIPEIYKTEKEARDAEKGVQKALLKLDEQELGDIQRKRDKYEYAAIKEGETDRNREESLSSQKELVDYKAARRPTSKEADLEDPDVRAVMEYNVSASRGERKPLTIEVQRGLQKMKGGPFSLRPFGSELKAPSDSFRKEVESIKGGINRIDSALKYVGKDTSGGKAFFTSGRSPLGEYAADPASNAYKYNANLRVIQQTIATLEQKGVLTDQDRAIYDPVVSGAILNDTPEEQQNRLTELKDVLTRGMQRYLSTSYLSGVNTNTFRPAYPEFFTSQDSAGPTDVPTPRSGISVKERVALKLQQKALQGRQ